MAYVNRRQQLMKQRREATQRAIEKRKKENKERRDKIGGSARAYYKNNPGSNTGNKSDKKKESSLNSRTHVMYKGKKVLKTSAMGKKAVANQKRDALAKKNYMSKEMIEKRKKRLKIKK